ncbi:acyl-CoA thioesterase [Paracraurococcus ruber]|nr:thioesterase family protein [Paracraurococcus ruber]
MSPEDRAAFGVEGEDWAAWRRHRVRWSECDALGHANNTAYLIWCEDMRVGPGWSGLGGGFAPGAVSPVVAQIEARYLRSLVFEEECLVTLRFASVKRTSFVHDYAVWKGGLCFSCRTVLVAVQQDSGARVPVPPAIRAAMLATGARDEAG